MSFMRSVVRLRAKPKLAFQPAWLIVGLGNPGAQYAKTRHNVGFMCTNVLARRAEVRFRGSGKDRADTARAVIGTVPALLVQPVTYMNESGVAVARLCRSLNIRPDHVLLIYDEVDLPFGSIRIRAEGSAGGHRGVRSVIDSLRTNEFPRIRVGIGRGAQATRDYVLTEFAPHERARLPEMCAQVADAVEVIVSDGVVTAMNRFNSRAAPSEQPQGTKE
jgi:PTH1 family peptidyl-tRNA hydrolase